MGWVIDWSLASQVARGVSRLQPSGDPAPFEVLDGPAEESQRLVSAYTGLVPDAPLPVAEAVGRDEWAEANLALDEGRAGPGLRAPRRRARPAQRHRRLRPGRAAGRRGRRDLRLPRRPRARPVRVPGARPRGPRAPAVRGAQPRPGRRPSSRPTRTSCCAGSRCTRPRTRSSSAPCRGCAATSPPACASCSSGMSFQGGSLLKIPDLADLKGLVDSVREDGIATLALGPERRELFDGMQALMAVLEGYAEHVMDAVGERRARRPAHAARRAEPAPARALRLPAPVRAPDRHGPQAAPVRAGQALLRRRGRPRRHRDAQSRLGLARGDAHARPSSTIRSPGSPARSGWASIAPPSAHRTLCSIRL